MSSNRGARTAAFPLILVICSAVALSVASCAGGDDDAGGTGGTGATGGVGVGGSMAGPRPFRSDTLLPLAVSTLSTCKNVKSVTFPNARRPLCAETSFNGITAHPPCVITGLQPGCECYEGQAHACDRTTGGACESGVDCGVMECEVTGDNLSQWSACKTATDPAAAMASPATGFRSDTTLPLSVVTLSTCKTLKSGGLGGRRPVCAVTTFESGTPAKCTITGLKAGCECYEGQAHACDLATSGPCTAGGGGCGVKKCVVMSDSSSSWSTCMTAP